MGGMASMMVMKARKKWISMPLAGEATAMYSS